MKNRNNFIYLPISSHILVLNSLNSFSFSETFLNYQDNSIIIEKFKIDIVRKRTIQLI